MNTPYYYVYRITNKITKRHYYGKRKSTVPPKQDLGIRYFSSSKDVEFIKDQKLHPDIYKYKIIKLFTNPTDALLYEIKLHGKFDVGTNSSFYNRAKQTALGFDTTGVKYSEERKRVCSFNAKGRKHTEETKEIQRRQKLGNTWNKGRVLSEHTKEKMRQWRLANPDSNKKLVNVYEANTGRLVSSNISITDWCKFDEGYKKPARSSIAITLQTDFTFPNSKRNVYSASGYYARYVNV